MKADNTQGYYAYSNWAQNLADNIGYKARKRMYKIYLKYFPPKVGSDVVDIGVTPDTKYEESNFFERFYPFKDNLYATSIEDASFLEKQYPGMHFIRQTEDLHFPFEDSRFEYVFSNAVVEHVGTNQNQKDFIKECIRIAQSGFFLTTPDRMFPVEVHTCLPFFNWIPKKTFRKILRGTKFDWCSYESNLNLLTTREVRRMLDDLCAQFESEGKHVSYEIRHLITFGFPSNILIIGHVTQ